MDVCTGAGALAGRFVGNVRPARKFVGRRPLLWFGYACRSGLHWPNHRRLNNADHGATAANVRSDSSEYVLSAYQLKGQGFAEQDGRLAETQPGQFVLYDTTRRRAEADTNGTMAPAQSARRGQTAPRPGPVRRSRCELL